jgi:hypothetical protein
VNQRVLTDPIPAGRLGWDHYTARLATAAAGGDPGPDPALVVF